jgi:uncharacterized protein YggE
MKFALILAPLALAGTLAAQTPRTIRASGEAVVSVRPDLARITVGVETQAATAQEAAAQNATIVQNVLDAVRRVLGNAGTTETVSYTINPNYRSTPGQPAVQIIDAASAAGANRINALRFGIRDEDPVRRRALTAAATQGRGHAEAIAAGLGGRVGMVLRADEGGVVIPSPTAVRATAGAMTPIETGLVEVRATVVVEVEFIPGAAT